MEISGVRLDVGIVRAQRQVAAVTLIPPFQPGVRGGFNHAPDGNG